jgi:hypothetical protein
MIMEINTDNLGIETVEDTIEYHISTATIACGQKYLTSDIHMYKQNVLDCDYKGHIENIAENDRNTLLAIGRSLPSRSNCLFVCKKEFVKYWYTYFKKRNKLCPQIYELKVNGTILWTYVEFLRSLIYWDIGTLTRLHEHEGLFEGEYEVIGTGNIDDF